MPRLAPLSCGFEADRADESVEVIDDALIEAVELRSQQPRKALRSVRAAASEK